MATAGYVGADLGTVVAVADRDPHGGGAVEPLILVRCHGCRQALTLRTVCPMCVRPSCLECLRVGGCRACLPAVPAWHVKPNPDPPEEEEEDE